MPTKIITKNSSVAAAVPTAAVLELGELAVNVTDKRLFTENASGAVVELGTNPSTIDINAGTIDNTIIGGTTAAAGSFTTISASGEIEANGGIALGDNDKATFGAGDYLQIYHDGYTAWFDNQESETKDTQIRVGDGGYITFKAGNENLILAKGNDNVSLYYNGSSKLATSNTGITVNGAATVSGGVYLGGTGAANHLDDYEEGTFVITKANDTTGTLDSGYTSHYTKVGNLVTVTIAFNPATNFSSNFVGGLPFVPDALSIGTPIIFGSGVLGDVPNTVVAGLVPGLSQIYFYVNQTIGGSHAPAANNGVYRLTFTYKTV